jgi:hypothetical protein
MLIGKCERFVRLLKKNDYNVRVTVVGKAQPGIKESDVEGSWKDNFRDSLGGGIVHDPSLYYVKLHSVEASKDSLISLTAPGNKIIEKCWPYLRLADMARIDLEKLPRSGSNVRSWVVVRD